MSMRQFDFSAACRAGDLTNVLIGLPDQNLREARRDGMTELMLATYNGNLPLVNLLVKGSDLQQQEEVGLTPLMIAANEGWTEIVAALIPGSDLLQQDKEERTALFHAVYRGNLEMVNLLIPGSDFAQVNDQGRTPLILAALEGHDEMVRVLLVSKDTFQNSLDVNQTDDAGCTARDRAIEKLFWIARKHEFFNPDYDLQTDKDGWTAKKKRYTAIVDILVEHERNLLRSSSTEKLSMESAPRRRL